MADQPENQIDIDRSAFREVVRNPKAHALVLGQYRVGEYAGVVGLRRLLGEMQPEGKLHQAMTIHFQDEGRHSQVFTDWIERLGMEPDVLPTDVEGFFARSPEEYQQQRQLLDSLPPEIRRIGVFAAINAVERGAYNQFEAHLSVLDRKSDRDELERVMREERFHLSYVEHELDRQANGDLGHIVTIAMEQAQARFVEFRAARENEIHHAIERTLGGAPTK
jgi:hypothetical protein